MKVTHITILYIVALGGIGTAIYFYNKSQNSKNQILKDGETGGRAATRVEDSIDESVFPLENGSRGEEVKILQQYLNRSSSCAKKAPKPNPNARMRPFLPLAEDGIFWRTY